MMSITREIIRIMKIIIIKIIIIIIRKIIIIPVVVISVKVIINKYPKIKMSLHQLHTDRV